MLISSIRIHFDYFHAVGPEGKQTQGPAHHTLVLSNGTSLHVHNVVSKF